MTAVSSKRMIVAALACFVLVQLSIMWMIKNGIVRAPKKSMEAYASEMIAACSDEGHKTSCYTKEVPQLMRRAHLSLEEAFEVTRILQERDSTFLYCHVLAHEISFTESRRNQSSWKDIMGRCPLSMCNYGCLHGSLIEHFRGQQLTQEQIDAVIPDLADVCEERGDFAPTELDKTMCYHALGHLSIYITDGDPDPANRICEAVSVKPDGRDYTKTCVEGVFMTVFQGVDPEDIALVADIKPEPDDAAAFCARYPDYWVECRRESYALYYEELRQPERLLSFCSYATNQQMETDCYYTVLNLVAVNIFERGRGMSDVEAYCESIPQARKSTCFAGIAMRLVQIDPRKYIQTATEVCELGRRGGVGDECYSGLLHYGDVSFAKDDPSRSVYCDALHDEKWKQQCYDQNTTK